MAINVAEITSILKREIAGFEQRLQINEVGTVIEVGDGIARIYGLRNAMAGELLEFENGVMGQVFNLEEDSIGAVIFGDYLNIKEGDSVKTTGRLLEVPVGDAVIGRVVNPLGQPLDGGPAIQSQRNPQAGHRRPRHRRAPARQRAPADRHQGDRQHDPHRPRPARADHRRPQDRQDRHRPRHHHQSKRHRREMLLRRRRPEGIVRRPGRGYSCKSHGAMEYTTVVVAGAADPAPLQYIAPYAGCAMAEYFMWKGQATLCVYDDLTKQAAAYRQLSLLLRRPPGREAYPGDVFYLHSRLLERAVKLSDEKGGG